MNLPVPYTHWALEKQAADEETNLINPFSPEGRKELVTEMTTFKSLPGRHERTYDDWLREYYDRYNSYANEVQTDENGTHKRHWLSSLGILTTAVLSGLGGAAIGGLFGGRSGALLGATLGTVGGMGANAVGGALGYSKRPRTRKEQMDYTNNRDDGILEELLIPGVAGYNRGRTAKHIQDVVGREVPASEVNRMH